MPTILALADAPLARPADGVSLLGPLLGRSKVAPRALYSEVNRSIQALDGNAVGVRTGERKMIRADWEKSPHLFDLRSDPGETRDLFYVYPEVANRLRKKLDDWEKSIANG